MRLMTARRWALPQKMRKGRLGPMEPSASHRLRPVERASDLIRRIRAIDPHTIDALVALALWATGRAGWLTRHSSDSECRDYPSPDTCLTANLQTTAPLLRAFRHRPKAKVPREITGSIEARAIVRNLELQPSAS